MTPKEIKKLAQELASFIIPSLDISFAPCIQTNIAEAFAAITPTRATLAPVSNEKSTSTEAGMEIINVDTVMVQPAGYDELDRLTGPTATFLSKEQVAAIKLATQWKDNLFLILEMRGSKSLVFMAAAVNTEEIKEALITVVVVPLKALL
jgi:superfamily II DNA helicase RecQ